MTAILPPSQETADFTVNIGRAENMGLLELICAISDAAFRRPELRDTPIVSAFFADAAEYSHAGPVSDQLPLAAMLGACTSRMSSWVRPIDGGTALLFRDLRGDFSSAAVARVIRHFLYASRSRSVVRWITTVTPPTDQRATSNSFAEVWCVSAVQEVRVAVDEIGRKVVDRMRDNLRAWHDLGCHDPDRWEHELAVHTPVLSAEHLLLIQHTIHAARAETDESPSILDAHQRERLGAALHQLAAG